MKVYDGFIDGEYLPGHYVLYSDAQARIEALENESQWERNKRQCAETRAEDMRTAIRVYIAEKKQPGSDRRAEFAALATLERYAATEATR